MPLFPARSRRFLRYHTNASLVSAAGVVTTYVFRANDLFDPDFTSTGHQPMGFDQMMVFYNHFAVDHCKIKVQFTNLASGAMHCGVRLDADSTPITSADQIMEFGGVTVDICEGKNIYGSNKELTASIDVAKVQGVPRRNITTDPNLRGTASTSPVECSYFHVFVWDPLAAGGTVQIDVTLDYSAWFSEPRTGTLSLNRDAVHEMKQTTTQVVRTDTVQARANSINAMAEAAYRAVGDRDVRLRASR